MPKYKFSLTRIFIRIRTESSLHGIYDSVLTPENKAPQSAFICSKLTTETLEQGVKYVQS